MNAEKKILIIQTAFIGDVILTTPLIRETKKVFPDARIDVLVIPQTKNVLENNPYIHSLMVFDKRKNKRKAFIETASMIRNNNYDFGFAAHRSMTTAWLMIAGGIKRRIGFTGKSAAWLMSTRVFFNKGKRQIERYLDLLRVFKDDNFDCQTELFFNDQILQQAGRLLSPVHRDAPTVAIAPGSVRTTKRWPEDRFVDLVKKLEAHNINIVLIGSPGEKALCDRIRQNAGSDGVLNLAGETSLLEAAAVIKNCDLLICNDSGTMHMANAVRTDVFAIFGPTVERLGFSPFRPHDKIFQIDIECRPCSTHGGQTCPKSHFRCMLDIDVQWLYSDIVKKLRL